MVEQSDYHAALAALGGRGDRPLSLLDLVERGTCDLELAAWLMERISGGASYIVGAGPGGVGKTTIMRALLGFVPTDLPFAVVVPEGIRQIDGARTCVISHELSDHRVPGYLWGADLRHFFALGAAGHLLVSNMHADTMDQAAEQIVGACGVPAEHLRACDLFVFIRREAESERRLVECVYYSDGQADHKPVYQDGRGLASGPHRDAARETRCRDFLQEALAAPPHEVQDLRHQFLAWRA